ncbi:hypothetical protein [Tissierella praeacuta]|uniref:hypothetical protein n=1 Tax=Tissierella praeacuta TaxID=43131 RepID=UPI003342CF08
MEMLLKRIDRATNEVINKNVIMDMTERQMVDLISEDAIFIKSISSACPTSFLACC